MTSLPALLATTLGLLLSMASFAAVPVADPLAVTGLEDKGKVFTVTATDADPGSSLAYQVATQPVNGKLIGTGPTFIYVPFLNYNGADSFTFTAHDGQNQSAPATVSITVTPVAEPTSNGAPFAEFVDPNPNPGNQFGASVVVLNTGNVVITSPFDDAGGTDAGAVYLFNGATGALISTLRGSTAGDAVGSGSPTALSNGNYVVSSHNWDNGAVTDAGAVTWGNGSTGISGVVSSSNSLVGSSASDQVGNRGVTALRNGNYVVHSSDWDNGAATNAGAVTWGNGSSGTTGAVSSSNSLVGSRTNDSVGYVTALSNGNYVVISPNWNNGTVADAGAATWGNGSTGISGVVSSSNSLVGSTASDKVGYTGVTALSNGNYVVASPFWNNGAVTDAGAATWGNGITGVSGVVSSGNSVVGSRVIDRVGYRGVNGLSNGNYVVNSPLWDHGTVSNAGAVTWGNGSTGVSGVVSSSNSLVGSTDDDSVGNDNGGVTALRNGNYVVSSESWSNGAVVNAGAATWGNGSTGISGEVSGSNSLVGTTANDFVGSATALSNGNYVVVSPYWDNGAVTDAGAVTWVSGSTGASGSVSSSNSLVGSTVDDLGGGYASVTALSNGNYVVNIPDWDNGVMTDAGAVTWGNGNTGVSGVVSSSNSLLGLSANAFLLSRVVDEINQTFIGRFQNEGSGKVRVGSQENGVSILPFITAPISTAITLTTATFGAHVTAPGAAAITERGVVYSLTSANADPLITGSGVTKVATTGTTGVFTVPVDGLASNSGYSFKGYATNSFGTSYSTVSTFATPTAAGLFSNSAGAVGLTGINALPNATPFHDGIENLLKYAFNMNLAEPDVRTMTTGDTAGLPHISRYGIGAASVLRIEFVRRIGSGLVYTPKKSTTLVPAGWTTLSVAPTVTPVGTDGLWERVIYEEPSDPAVIPVCFGSVEVAIP